MHRQNIATAVVNYVIYVTAARSRRTSWIFPRLPRLRWHVVGLSLKLWCTPNGPVLDGIRRILVHPQNNETGAVNKPKIGLIYDTRVPNTLCTTPRHVRGTFAAHIPDLPDAATAVLAWCGAIIEAIVYRKRPGVRRDT